MPNTEEYSKSSDSSYDKDFGKKLRESLCTFSIDGSIRPEVFYKIGVLKNFPKFTGKDQSQGLFFNKVASMPATLLKKETLAQVFFCEFCEPFNNTFLIQV